MNTSHNPDQCIVDLRKVLSHGNKRIGLLVGAGAAVSVRVTDGRTAHAEPLIPDVDGLTTLVLEALGQTDRRVIDLVSEDLGDRPNVEAILSRIRQLADALGSSSVHGVDGLGFDRLAAVMCEQIGKRVEVSLPDGDSPYVDLVSWITGTRRDHPVEVYTPNYDLLIEEALERRQAAYFDGFVGARRPFFDAASVLTDALPSRWALLWKLHGSLGWEEEGDNIVRTGKRDATALIYPEHRKYTQIGRLPYSALFERLRLFLKRPDTVLLCTGFSFSDAHICAALEESLESNAHAAVFAFQYKQLVEERAATQMARRKQNMSVYAPDGAVIGGVEGIWRPGQPPNKDWKGTQRTFWREEDGVGEFTLGDFSQLARFLARIRSQQFDSEESAAGDDASGRQVDAEGSAYVEP